MKSTIAQQCLDAPDPLEEARKQEGYKGRPDAETLRFHFEDSSYLDFKIAYTPAGSGMITQLQCGG